MPVEKFRSAEELNAAPPRQVSGPAFERFVRHCARFRRISPPEYPRGVFKFKTLAEAQQARERARAGLDR